MKLPLIPLVENLNIFWFNIFEKKGEYFYYSVVIDVVNEWVKRSIKFASEKYYLDNLSNVYPPDTDSFRHLELGKITNLRNVNDNGTNAALLEEILKTMKKEDLLSPVKDVYLGSLKEGGNEFLLNNPKTVSRIIDMIHGLYDFD